MKKTKLLVIPALLCLTGIMGCSKIINSLNGFLSEDEESGETSHGGNQSQGGQEGGNALGSILKLINDRNYYLDFTGVSQLVINYSYIVDSYHVYIPATSDYYDYTAADTEGQYEYYEYDDVDQVYYHGYASLAGEPGYSRLITRARLSTSDFVKTNIVDQYEMVEDTLEEFGLSTFQIVYNSRLQTITYSGQCIPDDTVGSFSFSGQFYEFGQAHVTLPSYFINE